MLPVEPGNRADEQVAVRHRTHLAVTSGKNSTKRIE